MARTAAMLALLFCASFTIAGIGIRADAAQPAGNANTCTCPSPTILHPVCGKDGVTHVNECLAGCSKVAVDYKGGCRKKQCGCPKIYKPVCGESGTSYGNKCIAGCYTEAVYYEGLCKAAPTKPCSCQQGNFEFACGKDGKTYANACEAQCAGAVVQDMGACVAA